MVISDGVMFDYETPSETLSPSLLEKKNEDVHVPCRASKKNSEN